MTYEVEIRWSDHDDIAEGGSGHVRGHGNTVQAAAADAALQLTQAREGLARVDEMWLGSVNAGDTPDEDADASPQGRSDGDESNESG